MSDETSAAAGDASPGDQVAGYRLEEKIGQGGMAVVYRAHDEQLNRRVALKLLAPGLTSDPAFRARFVRESQAAASVDHPNIIPVYGAGDADGYLYIAMRYVQGGDVRALISEGRPLSPARVWNIVTQIGSALDAAHARGLVHRDVKPANMLLDASAATTGAKTQPSDDDQQSHVYLSDFGISKQDLASHLTSTGQFVGTLDYIAPEQIEGVALDGRADQYALACTAYELLTGEPPFLRAGGLALINAHLAEQPPSALAKRPELPAAVDRVLAKAMAKSPDLRYGTCTDFAADLGRALGLLPGQAGVAQPTVAEAGTPRAATELAMPVATPVPTQAVTPGQIAAATAAPAAVAPAAMPAVTPPAGTPAGVDVATMAAMTPPPQVIPGAPQGPPGQPVAYQPQPGTYPGPQPGTYPGPQPGTYPGPQPGAYPPGAYPPGAYPPGAYPPGTYPQQYPVPGGPTTPGWQPQYPPQPPKKSKGPMVGAIAGAVVVVAAVAVAAVVLTSKNSNSRPTPPPSSSSTPATTPATTPPVTTQPPTNTAQSEANSINSVLTYMANSRSQLGTPSQEVTGCSDLSSAVSQIQGIASSRSSQLASAQNLPVGLLPNGGQLKSQLLAALRVSLRADRDYIAWGQDEESGGCGSGYGPAQDLNSVNPQATASKDALCSTWDSIASQYGLPQYYSNQI